MSLSKAHPAHRFSPDRTLLLAAAAQRGRGATKKGDEIARLMLPPQGGSRTLPTPLPKNAVVQPQN